MRKKPFSLHTLYGLKKKNGDVLIYGQDWTAAPMDGGELKLVCTFPASTCKVLDRRNRYVTVNCWKYKLEWLTLNLL